MHRKQRKKIVGKLNSSRKKRSLYRVAKRKGRSKSKTPGASARPKKVRAKKKEEEWRRNAIKPETLPTPQLDIPRIINESAFDENCSMVSSGQPPCTQSSSLPPRRGRSAGLADNTQIIPRPHGQARSSLKHNIDRLRSRIKSIHIPGRPVTNSRDPEILGHELKLRLATKAPLLHESNVDHGLVQFNETSSSNRHHVTMYDITIDDDIYKSCEMRVPKPSATTLMLEKLLNRDNPDIQNLQASNMNNNNKFDDWSEANSPESSYGCYERLTCPLM